MVTSDMQDMVWGELDLADTAVDLENDADFCIIICIIILMFSEPFLEYN